jgi:REP element-mobilizing transposase RayT
MRVGWLPVFTRPQTAGIILDSWRFLQEEKKLRIYGFVILENHIHIVAQADNLPFLWSRFKSYTARLLIDYLKKHRFEFILNQMRCSGTDSRSDREYHFWQQGSHPQLIGGEDMLRQKLQYIHQNPVKRGYVDVPEHWRWSSARFYAGGDCLLDVFADW